jgi:hypothetical protein
MYLIWDGENSEALRKFTEEFIHPQLSGEIFSV